MIVLPGTSTIHAETFARALQCPVAKAPEDISPGEIVFVVGIKPAPLKEFREKGCKVIAYWIGSDSLCATQDPKYRRAIEPYDLHLVVHERIQDELKSWGVESKVVYPCARNTTSPFDPPKHPTQKRVGIYSPSPGPDDLYMFEECIEIAKELPELEFSFYGAEKYPDMPPNCTPAGRMTPEETKALYDSFSCILRLVRHDGNPVGGIEAKMRGLHVLENFPYQGFLFTPYVEDVLKALRDEKTHLLDDSAWPAWYREQCSPEMFKRKVEACGLET